MYQKLITLIKKIVKDDNFIEALTVRVDDQSWRNGEEKTNRQWR